MYLILQDGKKSAAAQKAPEVWQKSVGSLSSKQKLKGLVTVKKRTPLSTASSTVTSSMLSNTASKSGALDTDNKTNGDATNNSKPHANGIKSVDSADKSNGESKDSDTASEAVEVTSKLDIKTDEVKAVVNNVKSNALSLLGDYPDSDSSDNTSD